MTWEIAYVEETTLIRIQACGSMDLCEITAMGSEALSTDRGRPARKFLLDARHMTPDITTTGIYRLPGILNMHGLHHGDRVAIVYAPDSAHACDFEFFETVSVNRAFRVRLFDNESDAMRWLQRAGREQQSGNSAC